MELLTKEEKDLLAKRMKERLKDKGKVGKTFLELAEEILANRTTEIKNKNEKNLEEIHLTKYRKDLCRWEYLMSKLTEEEIVLLNEKIKEDKEKDKTFLELAEEIFANKVTKKNKKNKNENTNAGAVDKSEVVSPIVPTPPVEPSTNRFNLKEITDIIQINPGLMPLGLPAVL